MNRRQRRKQQIARQSAVKSHQPGIRPSASDETQPAAESPAPIEIPKAPHPLLQPAPSHSTGPRTDEGKTASSRNAVRHGLCAKKLTGPDLDALNAIRARLDNEWEPQTETENMLLAQMALSQWRLERALELELAAFDGDIDSAALSLALRYRASAERTFFKSLSELQRLRDSMRKDAIREVQREQEEEEAILRQLEAEIFKPYRQFVSQNNKTADPAPDSVSQKQPPEPLHQAA
jgi:hypothetical protein